MHGLIEKLLLVHLTAAAAMAPQAAAKVDPRLLLIHKDPGLFAKKVGKTVNIQGSSLDEAILPVLIKTTALTSRLESAGAYFYQLRVDQKSRTKRMILYR